MITDDPGTPGDGNWEINIAALSNRTADAKFYQLPLLDANYGVGDRIQLKFEMPWMVEHGDVGGSRDGLNDGLAGVKWRFYDAGENDWQISTYPQVQFCFPGSNPAQNGFADSGTSYLLPLEFVRTFEGWDLNFEVGRWLRPTSQGDTWIGGAVLTKVVQKGFEVIAELHDEVAVHATQNELIFNIGARYELSERYTLLFSAGHDLRNTLGEKNMLMTYVGLQLHL
ncbi:MAG: hypothetical protein JO269_02140 [Burkholderiaceae bacterium]|nr:hypothetical protein [Burkholderiaceae bacterium]